MFNNNWFDNFYTYIVLVVVLKSYVNTKKVHYRAPLLVVAGGGRLMPTAFASLSIVSV